MIGRYPAENLSPATLSWSEIDTKPRFVNQRTSISSCLASIRLPPWLFCDAQLLPMRIHPALDAESPLIAGLSAHAIGGIIRRISDRQRCLIRWLQSDDFSHSNMLECGVLLAASTSNWREKAAHREQGQHQLGMLKSCTEN